MFIKGFKKILLNHFSKLIKIYLKNYILLKYFITTKNIYLKLILHKY